MSLERFVAAQQGVWERALAEVRAGAKRTHWMWFVCPQLRGLGRSAMANHFGLADAAEARAYLAHPLLGPRLREITTAALPHAPDARKLFGAPDDLKFHACMTLFDATVGGDPFAAALSAFFAGRAHPTTLELLG